MYDLERCAVSWKRNARRERPGKKDLKRCAVSWKRNARRERQKNKDLEYVAQIHENATGSSHKSPKAAETLKDVGASFLFLPAYSPDLNPIEMAFAKFKARSRKMCARTFDQGWKAIGEICNMFSPQECRNDFKAAGYEFML